MKIGFTSPSVRNLTQKFASSARKVLLVTTLGTAALFGAVKYDQFQKEEQLEKRIEQYGEDIGPGMYTLDRFRQVLHDGNTMQYGSPIEKARAHFNSFVEDMGKDTKPINTALAFQLLGLCASSGNPRKETVDKDPKNTTASL